MPQEVPWVPWGFQKTHRYLNIQMKVYGFVGRRVSPKRSGVMTKWTSVRPLRLRTNSWKCWLHLWEPASQFPKPFGHTLPRPVQDSVRFIPWKWREPKSLYGPEDRLHSFASKYSNSSHALLPSAGHGGMLGAKQRQWVVQRPYSNQPWYSIG